MLYPSFSNFWLHSSEICGPQQNATIASGMLSLNRRCCELAVVPYEASQHGLGGSPLQNDVVSNPICLVHDMFTAINTRAMSNEDGASIGYTGCLRCDIAHVGPT